MKRLLPWLLLPLLGFLAGFKTASMGIGVLSQKAAAPSKRSLASELESGTNEGFRQLMGSGRVTQSLILEHWMEADPAACFAWVMQQTRWRANPLDAAQGIMLPDRFFQRLYYGWADRDPRAALAALAAAPSVEHFTRSQLLDYLLQKDPLSTIPLMTTHEDTHGGFHTQSTWIRGDIPTLISAIVKLPEGQCRRILITQAIQAWAKEDPSAALQWVRSQGSTSWEWTWLFIGWGQKDPAAAVAYLVNEATPMQRRQSASGLIEIIAQRNPAQAWQAAQALHEFGSGIAPVFRQWKQSDPRAAAAAVVAIEDPQTRERIWMKIAQFTQWKLDELSLWTAPMTAIQRTEFLHAVMTNWSGGNLAAATEFITKAPAEWVTDEMISTAANHWTHRSLHSFSRTAPSEDSLAAVNWAQTLPSAYQEKAIATIFRSLITRLGPAGLQQSFDAVQDPKLRETARQALGAFAERLKPKN